MPSLPLYILGQDGEEGFWVWVGFYAMNSLSEGKRPCIEEACASINLFFFCLGLAWAAGCMLPRWRCRYLSTLMSTGHCGMVFRLFFWGIPDLLIRTVFLHTCSLAQFQVLCCIHCAVEKLLSPVEKLLFCGFSFLCLNIDLFLNFSLLLTFTPYLKSITCPGNVFI